ncbi:uncharacterized protein PF3D7_1120000-like [Centruroides vittatus]|uniref:uncharacterized protein PF3D7_1120000-like n=1 Tax=Centruroides vittatus TaxID=120091 RepID=UPI0035100D2A
MDSKEESFFSKLKNVSKSLQNDLNELHHKLLMPKSELPEDSSIIYITRMLDDLKLLQQKALSLYKDIQSQDSTEEETKPFTACKGLHRFKNSYNLKNIKIIEESASANEGAAAVFSTQLRNIIEYKDYYLKQVFICDETSLLWKKDAQEDLYTKKYKTGNMRLCRYMKQCKEETTKVDDDIQELQNIRANFKKDLETSIEDIDEQLNNLETKLQNYGYVPWKQRKHSLITAIWWPYRYAKEGAGRPRNVNPKVPEKTNIAEIVLSQEIHPEEQDYDRDELIDVRSPKIQDYFHTVRGIDTSTAEEPRYSLKSIYELIQEKFTQLNTELQNIKTEVNILKEENKAYQLESKKLAQKLEEIDSLTKDNSHTKGMLEFEIDQLLNEKMNKNTVIMNFPFKTTDYLNEIEQFIRIELGITNSSIDSLIKLSNNEYKPMVKIVLSSTYERNLILKEFWSKISKINSQEWKKIIFKTDLCRRLKLRRKKLIPIAQQEKAKGVKIIIRDDYYINKETIYSYDLNLEKVIQLKSFLGLS